MTTLRALLAGLVLLAGVAAAQPEPDSAESIGAATDVEVQLVELDVRVTDGDDQTLRGLTAEDFVLLVDGEEIPIEHFAFVEPAPEIQAVQSRVDGGSVALPEFPSAPGTVDFDASDRSRQLIIYLDERFLDAAELRVARQELLRFLRRDMPAGTGVMLASASESLRVVQGLTGEPALVADALQRLEIDAGGGMWRTRFDEVMKEIQRYHDMGGAASPEVTSLSRAGSSDAVRRGDLDLDATNSNDPNRIVLNQGENKGPTQLVETDPRYSLQMIESFGTTVESGLQASTSHLARLVSAASGLPGNTTVLYLGGTLPVNATRTLFELWQDTYGSLTDGADWVGQTARNQSWGSGVAAASMEGGKRFAHSIEGLQRVADMASVAGITIHTVDVSVPGRLGRSSGDVENFRSGADLLGGARSLDTRLAGRSDAGGFILADRTGGLSEANRHFEDFFERLAGGLRSGYTLAFSLEDLPPAAGSTDGAGLHDVEVRLRKDSGAGKANLRYRRRIAVKSLEQEMVERTVSALAMNLAMDNPLGIEVAAGTPHVGDDGQLRVPLSVKVPMSRLALIPDRQAHAGRLSIYVAVGSLELGVGLEKAVVPVRIANRDLLTAFGRSVDYRLEVSAPARAEHLAVTVRDDYRPARSTVLSAFGALEEAGEMEPEDAPAEGPF